MIPPPRPPAPRRLPRRAIARAPLREQVHRAVVERILRHDLVPGCRISDSAMADELGVSRTPVREALLRLEREGFLRAEPGRGFFVKPLCVREVREVYPVVAQLEVMALRACPPLEPGRREELNRLNALLEDEQDPERRIDLDVRWHRTLVEPCANGYLLGVIASAKEVIRRYEYAYMHTEGMVPLSTRTHADIVRHLDAGDADGAALHLEKNWRTGIEALAAWLEERD